MERSSSFRQRGLIFGVSLVLLCFLPVREASFWQLSRDQLVQAGVFEEQSVLIDVQAVERADFNGDGVIECLGLQNGVASINDCHGKILWQSPSGWRVSEARVGDLNRDGVPEAVLVVWRAFQPWPIDRNDPAGSRIKNFHNSAGESCHLILIGWGRYGYNELWAGSALIRPVSQIELADLDGDGKQELAALEGYYDSPFSGGALTVWRWRGFGFVLVDKKELSFQSLHIKQNSRLTLLEVR